MKREAAIFETEADLCRAFLSVVEKDGKWTAYPETAGFDILLSRKSDGCQIGIEAKLKLNARVVAQSLPSTWNHDVGPDYRAAFVPEGTNSDLATICGTLGVTVLSLRARDVSAWNPHHPQGVAYGIYPQLPSASYDDNAWHEWVPARRCKLPDYIPDVVAGVPSPVILSEWKLKAIKIAILLEERPVTRADFKHFHISPTRWTDPHTGWLTKSGSGFVAGPRLPDFKAQHPTNYAQIAADKDKWAPKAPQMQGAML